MTLRDRAKRIAAAAKERASSAGQDAKQRAGDAEVNEAAVREAKRRAARAARRAGSAGPQGSATPDVDAENTSRTKEVFARAQRYATASAPVEASMDPSPSGDDMWEFASAGNGGQPTGRQSNTQNQAKSRETEASASSPRGNGGRGGGGSTGGGADWGDNPEHLDEPEEVREELRADGLDPMDVATQNQAEFGHYLTHAFADDPGMGGRSREQLEAEHDMVVDALGEFGVEHDSPLEFDDPFGTTGSLWGDE